MEIKEIIFNLIFELFEHSTFELEYQHRAKSNPFSEKWLYSTKTKTRVKKLKKFLDRNIRLILNMDYGNEFYRMALKPFLHIPYNDLLISLNKDNSHEEMDLLYRKLYYQLTLDELFVLFTNVVAWEHCFYPSMLENLLVDYFSDVEDLLNIDQDLLTYYVRFLDVLSSSEIVSLFDLDALHNTLKSDIPLIGNRPLEQLALYRDWPIIDTRSFNERYPNFFQKVNERILESVKIINFV